MSQYQQAHAYEKTEASHTTAKSESQQCDWLHSKGDSDMTSPRQLSVTGSVSARAQGLHFDNPGAKMVPLDESVLSEREMRKLRRVAHLNSV